MFVGLIFNFTETSTLKYKCVAIGMPYVFLLVDILSWWLTKLNPMFAWLVIIAGIGMAISFLFMWTVSVLEMWWFNRAFINVQGERHPQWSVVVEAKFRELGGEEVILVLWTATKRIGLQLWGNLINQGLPLLKSLIDKFKAKK
jgi:hypothetical protein